MANLPASKKVAEHATMPYLLAHPERPPPEEYHKDRDFGSLCYSAAEVQAKGIELPRSPNPLRRLCLPLLVGVACTRCGSEILASMLDKLPYLSYGTAMNHQVLDFPSKDPVVAWPGHLQNAYPSKEAYAAGFPVCEDELAFEFPFDLLTRKTPTLSGSAAVKVLPDNPTILVLVPEPLSYAQERLENDPEIMRQLTYACEAESKYNFCVDPQDLTNFLRTCFGIPAGLAKGMEMEVEAACDIDLITRRHFFSSACPWTGVKKWLEQGLEPKNFIFLPTSNVTFTDPAQMQAITMEIAEQMGVAARFGPMEELNAGLSTADFVVSDSRSFGSRGSLLFQAPCVDSGEARVAQEKEIEEAVDTLVASGVEKGITKPKYEKTGIKLNEADRRIIKQLYDEHCGQPLADFLGIPLEQLYPHLEIDHSAADSIRSDEL